MSGDYMEPVNPVVGGTVLRRAAIQSPNYVTGVSGWTVNQDGSAEFNNLTIRGTFEGTDFVINTDGAFFYSGTPALGNLVLSITAAAGTDALGNAYLAGTTSYASSGGVFYAIQQDGQALTFSSAAGAGGPWSTIDASLALDATFTNLVLTAAGGIILDPLNGVSNLAVAFLPAQSVAQSPVAGGVILYTDSNDRAHAVNAIGVDMPLSGAAQASVSTITVTQAAFNALSGNTIIASDAHIGDIWRFVIFGYGTWGSTQQALTVQARFGANPTSVVGTAAVIAATALSASAAFQFRMEAILVCVTAGAAATWRASVTGTIAETANALNPGTAADNSIPFATGSGSSDITLDSTVNEIFGISAKWASTTGGPTITRTAAFFEKLTL